MKKLLLIALVYVAGLPSPAQTYITHVNVLDVANHQLLLDQTVGITGTLITSVVKANSITIPASAKLINGNGRFLMPGMVDAHIHFFQSGGLYARPDAIDLRSIRPYTAEIDWVHQNMDNILRHYLQKGITAVVDVGSSLHFLQQRDSFKTKNTAPDIYMTGPLITTWEPPAYKNLGNDEPFMLVTSPEAAREMVRRQLPFHPDFIKIWFIVGIETDINATAYKYQPIVKAAIDEAHLHHLRVAVHATESITARLAVASGCDYLVHMVEDSVVADDFIQLLKNKRVVVCPTLTVAGNYSKTFAQQMTFTKKEAASAIAMPLQSLSDLKKMANQEMAERYRMEGLEAMKEDIISDSIRSANLRKMLKAGIPIAAGTDAGNIGTLHGSSFFQELQAMKQAGMNNWQLIRSVTIEGAKAMGMEKDFGAIKVGMKANMLLLRDNPLLEIGNLQQIDLIINKGVVLDPEGLIKE